MIPIRLKIEGLYSYQSLQEIDFTRLTESGLFGIFGRVGSGKSSILEAISFALYGQTERLSRADQRSYNMMNLKSDRLFIEFEFLSGENEKYKFTVEGKRNSKNFEKVGTFKRRALRLDESGWTPLDHTDGEEIIGLSYDNFRRTVIIPQGKFQEFLQLGDTDRTRMLKELFSLDRFDLLSPVRRLQKKNDLSIEHINGQLQSLNAPSPELLEELASKIQESQKQNKELSKAVELETNELQEMGRLKALFEEKASAESTFQKLQAQQEEWEKREKEVKEYQTAVRDFRDLLSRQEKNQSDQKNLNSELNESAKKVAELQARLKKGKEWIDGNREEFGKVEEKKEEARELHKMAELLEKRLESRKISAQLERLATSQQPLLAEQKTKKVEFDQLKQALKKAEEDAPAPEILEEATSRFEKFRSLVKEIEEKEKEVAVLEAQIASETSDFEEKIKATPDLVTDSNSVESIKELIGEKLEIAANFIETEQKKVETLRVQARLADLAANLSPGEPCPLCGAAEHPNPVHEEASGVLDKTKNKLEKAKEKEEKLKGLLQESENFLVLRNRETERLNQLKQVLAEKKSAFEKSFSPNENTTNPETELQQLKARFSKSGEQIQRYRKKLETAEKQIRETDEKIEENKTSQDEQKSNLKALEMTMEILRKGFSQLKEENFSGLEPVAVRERGSSLQAETDSFRKKFERAVEEHQKLDRELGPMEGQQNALKKQLEDLEKEAITIKSSILTRLQEAGFESLDSVQRLLAKKLDVEAESKRIQQFRNELVEAQTRFSRLQAQLEGKEFDSEIFSKKSEALSNKKAELEKLQQQLGGLETTLKDKKEALKKADELQKSLKSAENRAENLSTLRKLFTGSGFVNYVSSVYLQELTNRANERFRLLTRNQLQLEISGEKNQFVVRDFVNGGQSRSIKTLSGGQTFQASLSLALALADSVQEMNRAERNFFFLDEGFGTLDREALRTVFETLVSLRKENRVVGVISHVEDLQQEIDVFLSIQNDGERGSLVQRSWE